MHTSDLDIALDPNAQTAITALDSGWVLLTFRKASGQAVTRLGTRNPSLIMVYGRESESRMIREAGEWNDNILYWDHAKGGLRSFCRIDLIELAIPHAPPEINH